MGRKRKTEETTKKGPGRKARKQPHPDAFALEKSGVKLVFTPRSKVEFIAYYIYVLYKLLIFRPDSKNIKKSSSKLPKQIKSS